MTDTSWRAAGVSLPGPGADGLLALRPDRTGSRPPLAWVLTVVGGVA